MTIKELFTVVEVYENIKICERNHKRGKSKGVDCQFESSVPYHLEMAV